MTFKEYSDYCVTTLSQLDADAVEATLAALIAAYDEDRHIFVIGNGGSAANASHLANDLAKGTRRSMEQPKRMKALALTDNVALMTAYANDEGYENIFSEQLKNFANAGDLLIAISGSGNSPNIVKAVEWARTNGLRVIGLTGFNGGKLYELSDIRLHVPLNDMCTSESMHSLLLHYITIELQKRLYEARPQSTTASSLA